MHARMQSRIIRFWSGASSQYLCGFSHYGSFFSVLVSMKRNPGNKQSCCDRHGRIETGQEIFTRKIAGGEPRYPFPAKNMREMVTNTHAGKIPLYSMGERSRCGYLPQVSARLQLIFAVTIRAAIFPYPRSLHISENKHLSATWDGNANTRKKIGRFQNPAYRRAQKPFLRYLFPVYFSCDRIRKFLSRNTGANV
jgi:hypothetical protein